MYQNYLLSALDTVLTWDLPEHVLPNAISDQMQLMANSDEEEPWVRYPD